MASTLIVGLRHMAWAERLSRAQCLSRSGVTPSKARAPSNTLEPSQKPCVRGPTIGWLPSSHSPSRKVKVCDQADIGFLDSSEGETDPSLEQIAIPSNGIVDAVVDRVASHGGSRYGRLTLS